MKSFSKLRKEACWTGYKAVGTKKKGDKVVPNCVPEEVQLQEEDGYPHEVHVRNYDEPDDENSTFPKDHVNYGVNMHHGTYKGATDKGYVFGFREKEHADKFVKHVNTHKYTDAEHISEEISQKDIDNFHKKLDKLVHHTFGKSSKEKKMKEDVEQIQEIGDTEAGREKLKSYKQKANLQKTYTMMRPSAPDALKDRQWKNRNIGTSQATKRLGEDGISVLGPTNTTGSGKVAGMGQPPGSQSGEPGVHPMRKKKVVLLPIGRRTPPKM